MNSWTGAALMSLLAREMTPSNISAKRFTARARQAESSSFSTQYSGWLSSLQPTVERAETTAKAVAVEPSIRDLISAATARVVRMGRSSRKDRASGGDALETADFPVVLDGRRALSH